MHILSSLFAIIVDTTLKITVLLDLVWAVGYMLKNRS